MNYEPGDPTCIHPLPDDWEFGGATGQDPRADPRWRPVTYTFLDCMLHRRVITQEPFCVHQARGSFMEKVNARGNKIFYVMAAPEGRSAQTIYADPDGAFKSIA